MSKSIYRTAPFFWASHKLTGLQNWLWFKMWRDRARR